MTEVLLCTKGPSKKYHTNPDCRRLPDRYVKWDMEKAEQWGYTECSFCAPDPVNTTNNGKKAESYLKLQKLAEEYERET